MLIYDDSFGTVMAASQREAAALHADAFGSEHFLLGLLAAGGPLAERLAAGDSNLDLATVRTAVEDAIDDAPHLERLGLRAVAAHAAPAPPRPDRMPRNRHTAELQTSLNSASAKLGRLRATGQLPRARTADSAVLWLAVLEPTARASALLRALGSDPDRLRADVLRAIAVPGAPEPHWPADVRPGPVTRLVHWFFNRASTSA